MLEKDKENKKGSAYYRDYLVKAISSEYTITIDISKSYKWRGRGWDTDIGDGGGATIGGIPSIIRIFVLGESGGNQKVIISGNPNKGKNVKDRSLVSTPADILAHELVSHAITIIGFSDTGDPIRNENKVRKQNNLLFLGSRLKLLIESGGNKMETTIFILIMVFLVLWSCNSKKSLESGIIEDTIRAYIPNVNINKKYLIVRIFYI